MDKIKIAQIGIGHNHGSEKMRAARSFPDVFEVVGVCEADPAWMKSRGSLDVYQGLPFMSEEKLLDVPGLAAVLVETDVWNLVPTAQRCIDRGLHVHIDKPAGENLAAFEKLLAGARSQSLVVQLAYMYRYNNAVQYAREMAASDALGEIFEIDAVMSTEHSRDFRDWLRHFCGGDIYCDRKRVIELPSMGGRYDELLLDFARCVRGEKENPFGYEHELLVHKATLKASGFEDIA